MNELIQSANTAKTGVSVPLLFHRAELIDSGKSVPPSPHHRDPFLP